MKQLLALLWSHIFLLGLVALTVVQLLEYYAAYSIWAVVLNPFKTGNLCAALWLARKCGQLKERDFDLLFERAPKAVESMAKQRLLAHVEKEDKGF